MDWKTPDFKEISLSCEVTSYASADLGEDGGGVN
jgi:coenzyme PQQ precursor peptide PqqA